VHNPSAGVYFNGGASRYLENVIYPAKFKKPAEGTPEAKNMLVRGHCTGSCGGRLFARKWYNNRELAADDRDDDDEGDSTFYDLCNKCYKPTGDNKRSSSTRRDFIICSSDMLTALQDDRDGRIVNTLPVFNSGMLRCKVSSWVGNHGGS